MSAGRLGAPPDAPPAPGLAPLHQRVAHPLAAIEHQDERRLLTQPDHAEELLADIDSNTVDTIPTYDESRQEPFVLPARIPNLLLNGADGIAVGMATKIPPHNLHEICDAVMVLIENAETTTEELADIVKGPDFPTGGVIYRMRKDSQLDDEGKRHDVMRLARDYGGRSENTPPPSPAPAAETTEIGEVV